MRTDVLSEEGISWRYAKTSPLTIPRPYETSGIYHTDAKRGILDQTRLTLDCLLTMQRNAGGQFGPGRFSLNGQVKGIYMSMVLQRTENL